MRLLTPALLFFVFRVSSQAWTWDTVVSGRAQGAHIFRDNYNNVYTIWEEFSLSTVPPNLTPNDTILSKYTDSGQLLWKLVMPNNVKLVTGVCSPDSSVYLLGSFPGTLHLGSYTATSNGGTDACLLKFDSNGALQWFEVFGSTSHDWVGDKHLCMQGNNVVIAGSAPDSMYFNGMMQPPAFGHPILRSFIARYAPNGSFLGVKFMSGWSSLERITSDVGGNVIAIFTVRDTMQIDNLVLIDTLRPSMGANHYTAADYIVKFNPVLQATWARLIANGYWHHSDYPFLHYWPYALRTNSQGDIYYITHISQGTNSLTVQPRTHELHKVSSAGTSDQTLVHSPIGARVPINWAIWWWAGFSRETLDLDSCDNLYFMFRDVNHTNSYQWYCSSKSDRLPRSEP
jgi:hypothetical protein